MKNFIITLSVMALTLLLIILIIIHQTQSPSGFDIYVVNTVNQAYLMEIKITNDKQRVLWHHTSISVKAHKPLELHPNFEFSAPVKVQVQLKSILEQKVMAETIGNWPGPAGISNQARILVGLVIKNQESRISIEFQNSIVFEESNLVVALIKI